MGLVDTGGEIGDLVGPSTVNLLSTWGKVDCWRGGRHTVSYDSSKVITDDVL